VKNKLGPLYTMPVAVWITVFFVAPLLIMLSYSVLTRDYSGGVHLPFTLAAYWALFNPVFLRIVLVTVCIAVASTLITLLLALPASYYIARSPYKNLLLLLVIVPFWTNFLIRIYAWIAILGNNGFLNGILMGLGITDSHIQFLYNRYAVTLVIVYTSLPYAILPLYATIEKFDFALLEAARDLGATKPQSMFKVLLPNIRPGITTAVLFTFIPAFGSYAVPQLVGGTDSMMLGTVIARELTVTRNWPLASSISMVLTVITTLGVVLFLRANRSSTEAARQSALAQRAAETPA
jgi:spermidine/putrescine transport system permease protein